MAGMSNRRTTTRLGILFVATVLGLSSLGAQVPDAVDTLKRLNRRLLEASSTEDGYIGDASSFELQRLLTERKAALAALIADDPGEALALSFPADLLVRLRAKYPLQSRLLESRGSWQGIAESLVADDETLTIGEQFHFLKVGRSTLEVHFAGPKPGGLTSGSILNVEGVQVDNLVAVEHGEVIASSAAKAVNGCDPIGGQRVVVILTRFPSYSLPSGVNAELMRGILRGNAYTSYDDTPNWSVDDFWKENSDGQTWVDDVRIVGPYTLSGNYNNDTNSDGVYDCQYDALREDAIAAADGAVDFTSYDRVLIVFPKNTRTNSDGSTGGCAWAGLGSVGCWSDSSNDGSFQASVGWLRGDQISSRKNGVRLGTHELGHNLGLLHANSRDFGFETLGPVGAEGDIIEYGSRFSTMGNWNFGFYSAQHATDQLGWLVEGPNVQVVDSNGSYTIQNYEARPAGLKALKVRRGTGNNAWLWIESRQDTGIYDSELYSTAYAGGLIHYQDDYTGAETHLVDFTADTNHFYDPALGVGESWNDPYSDLTLSIDSLTSSAMTVTVTYANSGGCLEADPVITLAPTSQTTLAGEPLNYSVSVSNQDGAGCGSADFSLIPSTPQGWTATTNPASLSIDPGQSGAATLTVHPPQGTPPATYGISLETAHSNATNSASSAGAVHIEATVDDLAVTSVTAPGSAVLGDYINVYVTVQNVGNVAVGQPIVVTLNDLTANTSIGSQTIAGLGVAASQTLTFVWNTAGAMAGTSHTLQAGHSRPDAVLANDSGSTTVALSQSLSFNGLAPSSLSMGTSTAVTITGTGFQSGATLECWNGSGLQPTSSNVMVVNSSTITAMIHVGDDDAPQDRGWNIRVTNPGGASATFAGLLTVLGDTPQDGPPQVTISSPANGASLTLGDSVNIAGSASDLEDGNLTANLVWSSNLAGPIGNGGNFNWTPNATGTHVITASVTDSNGQAISETVSMTVNVDQPPTVGISSPSDQQTYPLGATVSLAASATDSEDGNISHLITWSSNLEGPIGSGASRSWTPSVAGLHILTASVTDSGNNTDSAIRGVTVYQNSAPLVSITSPSGDQALVTGGAMTLSGSAMDGEDGDISHLITWTSSMEGSIGSGAVVSWTPTAAGVHTITASVVDSRGSGGSANTAITVDQGITVTFSAYKSKGRHRIDLRWTGSQGAQVEIQRSGTRTANITTANDGQYLDAINKKGQGRYTYQVCEAGRAICSPEITVRF